jgi:hydrogenase expression/formation protein HypE
MEPDKAVHRDRFAGDLRGRPLPTGKLPARHLEALLAGLPQRDPRVIVGPRVGEDAAVLDLGDRCLVVTTDPITFATDHIGWYAVHVNANDVAVLGARPRWFFAVLLLPAGETRTQMVDAIMSEIARTCEALGVTVCGGHTEITPAIRQPIVIGQMLGEAPAAHLVRKASLRIGDQILLTQGVAIEGTAILARERRSALSGRIPDSVLARADEFLFAPGISIVDAALTAVGAGVVHAMHDPTEGGLASGLYELASAAGTGLRVFADRIRVFPETRAICDVLHLDPLRLISSGALLVGASPDQGARIALALTAKRVPVSVIGEVRPASEGMHLVSERGTEVLLPPERDEIARVFEAGPRAED